MTGSARPLAGRTVLLLGAGDPAARAAALHLAARGAALVAAAPVPADAVAAAGLAAAAGATARVLEAPAPPLLGSSLLAAARAALATPTDALVAVSAFPDAAAAADAGRDLEAPLGEGLVCLVEPRPEGGTRAHALRVLARFLAAPR